MFISVFAHPFLLPTPSFLLLSLPPTTIFIFVSIVHSVDLKFLKSKLKKKKEERVNCQWFFPAALFV